MQKAFEKAIIIPPIIRLKSFKNLREYFYFIRAEYPNDLFERLKEEADINYLSIQTGFANIQVIAKKELDFEDSVVLQGFRSDYFVNVPRKISTEMAVSQISEKLKNLEKDETIDSSKRTHSQLIFHENTIEWDFMDELIYEKMCNNLRLRLEKVIKEVNSYHDKAWSWIKRKDEFSQTIVMYFPNGESSYMLTSYCITTPYDFLLIDFFSNLPTPTVFYRIRSEDFGDKLMMNIYLPFGPELNKIVKKSMEEMKKKELIDDFTSSIVEYGYRR